MEFEKFDLPPEAPQEPINIDGEKENLFKSKTREIERRISVAEDVIKGITQDLEDIKTYYDSVRPRTLESENNDEQHKRALEESILRWNKIVINLQSERMYFDSLKNEWVSHILKGKGSETDIIQ